MTRVSMTEDQIKAAVIDLAEKLRWDVYSIRRSDQAKVQGKTGKGYPDLTLSNGAGGLVFVELKSAKGKVTADQERWLASLGQVAGAHVCVWRPEQWLDGSIERFLRKRSRGWSPGTV